jgi:peptidyl-prolyl cis-trans isomerase B (cyclophilin B)
MLKGLTALFISIGLAGTGLSQAKKPPSRQLSPAASPGPSLSIEELKKLQAVLETSKGDIVLEFFPDKAPAHVRYFVTLAKAGFYPGTTFHRVILRGIIQGGDPFSKDPTKRTLYGSGGLKKLKAEFNDTSHVRGTVSAVLIPGDPDSAGSQFFICVSDQPQLNGKYTAWAKVVEGMDVVDKISATPADANQLALERIEIRNVVLRPIPPPQPTPFADASKEEMKAYHAVLQTSLGKIEVEFFPDIAPEHVRNFLKLAKLGFYDNTVWHRIVPGFVIQGGDLSTRTDPLKPEQAAKFVKNLQAELSELKHDKGTLSMARADSLDSASTSFFICLAPQPSLDGKYTIFGRVVAGLDVVDQIGSAPTFDNEKPKERIDLVRVEVVNTER